MTVPPYAVACKHLDSLSLRENANTNDKADVVTLLVSYSADRFNS